jgi:hypothetical protein
MHGQNFGPSLRSIGVLLTSTATTQSSMDYSIMAVDEEVVESPVTRAPLLERSNSLSPMWPRSRPRSPPSHERGCTFTKGEDATLGKVRFYFPFLMISWI